MRHGSGSPTPGFDLFYRMIHALWTFASRFACLAGAKETLAAHRDHALEVPDEATDLA